MPFDSKRRTGGSHLYTPPLQPGLGDTREAAHPDPVVPDDLIVQVPQHAACGTLARDARHAAVPMLAMSWFTGE